MTHKRLDPHSHADLSQARCGRVELDLAVDFPTRTLSGTATLVFTAPAQGGPVDLDTRELRIERITDLGKQALRWNLSPPERGEEFLGQKLTVDAPAGTRGFIVTYRTSPEASALQWLTPAQTAGKRHPYLFSQCQAIHARSVAPLQDTPLARITYAARLRVPKELRALMGAAFVRREEPVDGSGEAIDVFDMPQPIPPYLLAFAVGELARHELTARMAVWAEPAVLEAAAWEFAEIDQIMRAAESLFGPYDWDRYDVLVMPPSFPYGGMENPRLTFATPSLLAGDRSLVNVIAHELAHAWTGNLVSNASANDFWLNEGFTVYFERRIVEAVDGREGAELQSALGRGSLLEEIARFSDRPEMTRLRTSLWGVDPDDVFSRVPYEKGYLFLRRLEELAGREKFDAFLKGYLRRFRFQSITTDDFLDELHRALPGLAHEAEAAVWIDGQGLPPEAPEPKAERLHALHALSRELGAGKMPGAEVAAKLTPLELQLVLQELPETTGVAACEAIAALFGIAKKQSVELRCAYLEAALRAGAVSALEPARALLLETGRMKFLKPLYRHLAARPETKEFARKVFAEASAGYHPIARGGIAAMLK